MALLGRVGARDARDAEAELGLDHHDRVLRRYVGEDAPASDYDAEPAWWRDLAVREDASALRVAGTEMDSPESPEAPESLHCAVCRQDQAAVDRLLAADANPDEPDYSGSGDTPLMQAVASGHIGIVRSLCAAGCNVDARRVNGQAPLMLCVVSRASRRSPRLLLQLLETLLEAGADPGVREKLRGQTALHALARVVAGDPREPSLLAALRLLAQRAQPHGTNAQDHRRRTALHHLAGKGCAHPEPYKILLAAGADPALQNARGDTPLVEFLENVSDGGDAVRLLEVLAGRDAVSRLTQYGESALHVAARRNRLAAVRVALEAGADPAHQDLRGNTPLHLAASRGYKDVVSLLLSAPGCPVNAENRDGYTPLHVAVESGFIDVVHTLLGSDGVEVGPGVLAVAQQEYRLRAQPQLARTLECEMDRRSGANPRASLSLSSASASTRPSSTSSVGTTASSCTRGATSSPQRTPSRASSRRTLADDDDAQHPVNYLGAQISCTARIRPRYSALSEQQNSGCVEQPSQAFQPQPAFRVHEEERRLQARSVAVDVSLREAAELMQKLCDEDLSASPPADWSPPIARVRPLTTGVVHGPESETPEPELSAEPVWQPRSACSTEGHEGPKSVPLSVPVRGSAGSRRTSSVSGEDETSQSASSRPDSRRSSHTESRRSSGRMSSDMSSTSRKFRLPANPYATIRGCPGGADDADEDSKDYLVESLLAVAKSITGSDNGDIGDLDEQFDRTGEIPKDYELFERSVLFGEAGSALGVAGVADGQGIGQGLGALRGARVGATDTAIASR